MKRLILALCAASIVAAAHAKTDPVLEWNEIMVDAVAEQPPPFMNRFAAIMHLAVFEAVNAIEPEYEPYLGTISAPAGASADAAAIAAAHKVLVSYFPTSAPTLTGRSRFRLV